MRPAGRPFLRFFRRPSGGDVAPIVVALGKDPPDRPPLAQPLQVQHQVRRALLARLVQEAQQCACVEPLLDGSVALVASVIERERVGVRVALKPLLR